MNNKTVSFEDCTAVRETDKALLVSCPDWKDDRWIPKSQIDDDSEVWDTKDGKEGVLIIAAWWADKEGL
jgi:hypothetical protein